MYEFLQAMGNPIHLAEGSPNGDKYPIRMLGG
jgi:hypothetical protein